MYINWILKSRKPRNSNLVRKNCENNYFSSRTKLEVLRYSYVVNDCFCTPIAPIAEQLNVVASLLLLHVYRFNSRLGYAGLHFCFVLHGESKITSGEFLCAILTGGELESSHGE